MKQYCRLKYLFLILSLLIVVSSNLSAQKETDVIEPWITFSDAPNFLNRYLSDEAYKLLDMRAEYVSRLGTKEKWEQRKQEIKQKIWESVGEFPEKTPLNVKTTSIIKKDGYTLENIIYESLPGFYVTASFFIPDNLTKPAPAVLFCTGHSWIAYRRDIYQLPLLNLVKKGFVVLAFDPVGQGERYQYWDYDKEKSMFSSSTAEHSYPAPQSFLIGQSAARYFIWDGIRGIDYLVSRSEVDASRIGVHGLSGGGTQTAYISALDDRVAAAAPAGYITSYKRLIESRGVQDGEQNFYHGLLNKIDHADFIEAMAPKPVLIMATTRDFFSIQGTRETFDELKRVYTIYDKPGNIMITEDDYGHGYTKKNREAMYAFFQKHLSLPGPAEEEEIEYLTETELQKTSSGQLATSLGGETLFSLIEKDAQKHLNNLQASRENNLLNHISKVPENAKKMSGYIEPVADENPVFAGRIQKEGYNIEKYFIKGEGDFVIPYLLLIPETGISKAVIYIHPEGKAGVVQEKEEVEWFISKGFTIIAPDLPGIGELENKTLKGDAYIDNISYNLWFTATLTGRSITGIQATETVRIVNTFRKNYKIDEVYGVARGEMSPVLLHAAVFEASVSKVALIKPYSSYSSFVQNRFYNTKYLFSLVSGALLKYDLPDLMTSLAPSKLMIAGAVDQSGRYLTEDMIEKEFETVKKAYAIKKANSNLQTTTLLHPATPEALFENWINL